MLLKAAGLAVVLGAFAGQSLAADVWSGCWARVYDDTHLRAHPGQKVTSIRLSLTPKRGDGPYTTEALLIVTLKGHGPRLFAGGDCQPKADGLYCPFDEDSGEIAVARSGKGLKVTVVSDIRLNRKDQGSDESTGPYLRARDAEDRVFLLGPGYPEGCRY
jgi:hypothetical protein